MGEVHDGIVGEVHNWIVEEVHNEIVVQDRNVLPMDLVLEWCEWFVPREFYESSLEKCRLLNFV